MMRTKALLTAATLTAISSASAGDAWERFQMQQQTDEMERQTKILEEIQARQAQQARDAALQRDRETQAELERQIELQRQAVILERERRFRFRLTSNIGN
jgi:hypothetical protein